MFTLLIILILIHSVINLNCQKHINILLVVAGKNLSQTAQLDCINLRITTSKSSLRSERCSYNRERGKPPNQNA